MKKVLLIYNIYFEIVILIVMSVFIKVEYKKS